MKTAQTIPWEAVVSACPPSRAKRLPLVISQGHLRKGGAFFGHRLCKEMENAIAQPLAMLSRSDSSSLMELFLPRCEFMAVLTSDGESCVVLQSIAVPWSSRAPWDQGLGRDSFARTYVARYARLDGDHRAFIANETRPPEREGTTMHMEFLSPHYWGFSRSSIGYHWTAENLFESASHPATPQRKDPCSRA